MIQEGAGIVRICIISLIQTVRPSGGGGGKELEQTRNKVETNKEEALHTHIQAAAQSIERHIYTVLAWDDLLSD